MTGDSIFLLFILLTNTLATIAIPYFFLISGYFYFKKTTSLTKVVYLSKTKKRIKTLLIPYIAWNVLAFLVPLTTAFVKGNVLEYMQEFNNVSPLSIFWDYKSVVRPVTNLIGFQIAEAWPLNVPLWFLRDLFIISLLSPIVYFLVKKTGFYVIGILGLCYFTSTWTSFPGFSIISIFFFSLGAYLSLNGMNIIIQARKFKYIIFFICLVSIVLDTITYGQQIQYLFIRPLYQFAGLLSAIILGSFVIEKRNFLITNRFRLFAKSSFFIYVAHTVSILGISIKVYSYIFKPENPFFKVLVYISISITTVIICFLLYIILKHVFPRFTKFITGDR